MKYNQLRAMLAITAASLRSIMRSPSAIIFSFVFPFIFILIFGFIGNDVGRPTYRLSLDKNADTLNDLFRSIKSAEGVSFISYSSEQARQKDLKRGRLVAIIFITKSINGISPYRVSIKSTTASADKIMQLTSFLQQAINKVSDEKYTNRPAYAQLDFNYQRDVQSIREYRTIDFILPGQLGFSLLSTGVFGVAFMFFNLRNTLVLKRFFATPISRTYIILGEGLSRVSFQMLTAIVIITVGYFFFGFTLVNGFITFLEMLILSFIGLVIFMGFGYIISGLAKNDSSIPPFANLITLPQFLLSGTFFSIDNFPVWLQTIAKLLPLTYLNMSMRSVAFEGVHFWNVTTSFPFGGEAFKIPVIFILVLWAIIVYAIAVKVFRWE